ncbi:MAG: TadE/TadG family type IV pilus assembly protein [Tepidisphaerales bacterium]
MNRIRKSARGNTVIEAALVLPILLSLAFGTIEFGYYFYIKHNLQGAAREGARAAIVAGATNADVTTAVTGSLTAAGLQNCGFTITTTPTDVSTATGTQTITVTVQCTWGTVGAGLRPLQLISASKIVKGTASMRNEG